MNVHKCKCYAVRTDIFTTLFQYGTCLSVENNYRTFKWDIPILLNMLKYNIIYIYIYIIESYTTLYFIILY